MNGSDLLLEPGSLAPATRARWAQALQTGALQRLAARCVPVPDQGIPFVVRILRPEDRTHPAMRPPDPDVNPFLPYDPELFVAEVSATHVALLNKFCVIDHHLLVVTRAFEPQESLLTRADFEALHACMGQTHGLAFYNAGPAAGASQGHKHLQLVPLPLADHGPEVPMAAALARSRTSGSVCELDFAHAVAHVDAWACGDHLLGTYEDLRKRLALEAATPYNLLLTCRWMLLIPRTTERFAGISVNALGFAGALLVRDQAGLELLRQRGPLGVLRAVARPVAEGAQPSR